MQAAVKSLSSFHNSQILLSVIIPVYNVESYLEACLQSVIPQLNEQIEVICINDGSTDRCPDILSQYEKETANFHVLNTENRGLAAARNAGINVARGEYLVFIDGDDFIESSYFANVIDILLKVEYPVDIIFVGLRMFDEKKGRFVPDQSYHLSSSYGILGLVDAPSIYSRIFEKFGAPYKIIRRNFFLRENLFYQEGARFEDVVPHVKAILSADKVYISDFAPYCYRFNRTGSIMNSGYDIKKILDIFNYLLDVRHVLKQKGMYGELQWYYSKFYNQQVEFHKQKINSKVKKKLFFLTSKLLRRVCR